MKIKKGNIFHIEYSEWVSLEDENNLGFTCKCTFTANAGFKIGDLYYLNSRMFNLKVGKHPKNKQNENNNLNFNGAAIISGNVPSAKKATSKKSH